MQRIIGESTTLANALSHVSSLAAVSRPVLVIGERGSGKELMAERLHYLSPRWDGPFHKVNCAAISETLIDSELFGHEAGAFTGATSRHLGHFERADGGTLFLDELATLPLRTQERLLRLVEYGEFERLGGKQTRSADVRIVGATHADLPGEVRAGRFRADLLDRLAFDVVKVPPLRARQEDIPELANHFAMQMAAELGHPYFAGFDEQAMAELLSYNWPGNIRELKNVVERSVHRWGERDTAMDAVVINPFEPSIPTPAPSTPIAPAPAARQAGTQWPTDLRAEVQALELTRLQQALERNQWRQQEAADDLGLSYHQLRAMMRKYGVKKRAEKAGV